MNDWTVRGKREKQRADKERVNKPRRTRASIPLPRDVARKGDNRGK